jgi:hypothetical protein
MRPYGLDEFEQLNLARVRAEEIRQTWRMANPVRRGTAGQPPAARPDVVRAVRQAVGRAVMALGQRLLPSQVEPCD